MRPARPAGLTIARPRFAAMDGLRGLAAALILLFHFGGAGSLGRMAPSAYLSVDLFFLLSGFVIAHAYQDRLRAGLGVLRFGWIRVLRLYPLALLGTLIAAAALAWPELWPCLTPASVGWIGRDLVKAALFVPHLSGDNNLFPLNPPMWSLLYEIAINGAYALALPWLTNRRLVALAAAGGLGVIASAAQWGNLDVGATTTTWLGGVTRVTWGFPVGVLLYRLWRAGVLARLPRWSGWPLVVAFTIACLPGYKTAWSPLLTSMTVLLLFPSLVALAAGAIDGDRTQRLFTRLGELSYPLYAVHWGMLNWAWAVSAGGDAHIAIIAAGLLAFPAAWAAGRWWDEPLRRRLSRSGTQTSVAAAI